MADLTLFVRRELASRPEVTSLLGSSAEWPVWLFRWALQVPVENSGSRAVVISQPRSWGAPNRHNTAAFPLVVIDVYSDPTRDASGRPVRADAPERGLQVLDAVREVMHVPRGAEIEWGNVDGRIRVVSSVAATDPEQVPVPDSEAARARMTFEVVLG